MDTTLNTTPRRRGRPPVPNPVPPAERTRRNRAGLAGTVALTRAASDALARLVQHGDTRQATVERVLVEAAARLAGRS